MIIINGILCKGDDEGASSSRGGSSGRTPYQFLPVSFTEIQRGNERLFFIKNEIESQLEESSSADPRDYQFEIDNSTGNLLIVHDVQDASRIQETITAKPSRTIKATIPSSSTGPLSSEQLTLLQVLDNGHCVLETTFEQITFHSADDDNARSSVPEQLQSVFRKKATQLRNENPQITDEGTRSKKGKYKYVF